MLYLLKPLQFLAESLAGGNIREIESLFIPLQGVAARYVLLI
jgi:hypothetical protein